VVKTNPVEKCRRQRLGKCSFFKKIKLEPFFHVAKRHVISHTKSYKLNQNSTLPPTIGKLQIMSNVASTRKRKRSGEDVQQKRQERIIRNRIAAQESRDRQKKHVQELEMMNKELKESNQLLSKRLLLVEEQNRLLMEQFGTLTHHSLFTDNINKEILVDDRLTLTPKPQFVNTPSFDPFLFHGTPNYTCFTPMPVTECKTFEEVFQDILSEPPTTFTTPIENIDEMKTNPARIVTQQQLLISLISLMSLVLNSQTPQRLLVSCSPMNSKPVRSIKLNESKWNDYLKREYPICHSFLSV
jgi:hypothetical protein